MIYLDNAATTKPIEMKITPFDIWGNPSALYFLGSTVYSYMETAKERFAIRFNTDTENIVYTSGATEGNNWIIRGIIEAYIDKYNKKPHIISSPFEHPSVRNLLNYYKEKDIIDIDYLFVDGFGHVILDNVEELITDNTCLVTCMYVNNEIGSIQPIAELGKICKNKDILFHVDGTQAVGKVDIDIKRDNINFLTCSAHKFHGPKGIGAVICDDINRLKEIPPLMIGGHQQKGLRGGTDNVLGIRHMTEALVSQHIMTIQSHARTINEYILKKLKECFTSDTYEVNSHDLQIPLLSVSFKDISGEYIMNELNRVGICLSTGSACTSGDLSPSYVLQAINSSSDYIQGTIRISFDLNITKSDIDILFKYLEKIVK